MTPRRLFRKLSSESLRQHVRPSSHGDDTDSEQIPKCGALLDHNLPLEYFKQDVINIIHKLRIPGWSLVTIDLSRNLNVTRISGALSNAVFAVKAPYDIKELVKKEHKERNYTHRTPHDLLLRVYGPQVDFLIDRKSELETLQELNKHNIGPTLLGIFGNGRFEQFLNAKPLTKEDIRDPHISSQIARRMRDLHDKVPLQQSERDSGFKIFRNIDMWAPTVKDKLEKMEKLKSGTTRDLLKCGSFDEFMSVVNNYEQYLTSRYRCDQMVFCHNDTQYGNIMKLNPPRGSPLLHPLNEYRKLVVIDFEYSGPNMRGYDIANHFCEWMYDYHHPTSSYQTFRERYPSSIEQENFISSYVEHGLTYLDEQAIKVESSLLLNEIRDWLPSVSIGWAFWGVIQTPIEDATVLTDKFIEKDPRYEVLRVGVNDDESDPEDGHEFDNFAYAKDKIQLFWDHLSACNISK